MASRREPARCTACSVSRLSKARGAASSASRSAASGRTVGPVDPPQGVGSGPVGHAVRPSRSAAAPHNGWRVPRGCRPAWPSAAGGDHVVERRSRSVAARSIAAGRSRPATRGRTSLVRRGNDVWPGDWPGNAARPRPRPRPSGSTRPSRAVPLAHGRAGGSGTPAVRRAGRSTSRSAPWRNW